VKSRTTNPHARWLWGNPLQLPTNEGRNDLGWSLVPAERHGEVLGGDGADVEQAVVIVGGNVGHRARTQLGSAPGDGDFDRSLRVRSSSSCASRWIAKSSWMPAEQVVAASLRGLDHGDLLVVPGWGHRFLVRLLAIVPDGLRRWGSLRYARRAKRV